MFVDTNLSIFRLVLEHAGPTLVGFKGPQAPRATQNGFAIEQSGAGTATRKRHQLWSMAVKAEHAERQWLLPMNGGLFFEDLFDLIIRKITPNSC